MARGNLTNNSLREGGTENHRLKDDSQMAELPEMSSLTLSDIMDIGQGTDERTDSGINTELCHIGDYSTTTSHRRLTSEYQSTDAGYRSSSMDRRPQQETEGNQWVIPTSSFNVFEVFEQDTDGDTGLHMAIIHKDTTLAMFMIACIPNCEWLNIVNLRLQSPLHLAVITKQRNIVRRLMVAGARVDRTDINGNTPLHIACREGYADIVECLLRPVCYEETHLNKYEIPYQRIPQDLNTRNFAGHTCVHLAALSTHLKVLELLVSRGADVNVKDGTSGRTALHYAAETGNRILLHFLLSQRKVNISCRTFGDLTPLGLAAGRRFGDVVTVLIANGADFHDLENPDDDDAIDDFCINGQPITN